MKTLIENTVKRHLIKESEQNEVLDILQPIIAFYGMSDCYVENQALISTVYALLNGTVLCSTFFRRNDAAELYRLMYKNDITHVLNDTKFKVTTYKISITFEMIQKLMSDMQTKPNVDLEYLRNLIK